MRLLDDPSGRGLDLETDCSLIVIVEAGSLLIDGGNEALVLRPGQAAGLLPGLHSWSSVGAPGQDAVVTVATLPDEAVGRLLDEGTLWKFFLNLAGRTLAPGTMDLMCPLQAAPELSLGSFIPGRVCEGLLRLMGGHPFDDKFYRFLAQGPLRHRVGEPEGEVPPTFVIDNPRDYPRQGDGSTVGAKG